METVLCLHCVFSRWVYFHELFWNMTSWDKWASSARQLTDRTSCEVWTGWYVSVCHRDQLLLTSGVPENKTTFSGSKASRPPPLSLHRALSGDSHHHRDEQEVRSEGAVKFLLCVVESVDTHPPRPLRHLKSSLGIWERKKNLLWEFNQFNVVLLFPSLMKRGGFLCPSSRWYQSWAGEGKKGTSGWRRRRRRRRRWI